MRKSFSGDREAAVDYYGLAKSRLDELKNLMQLGGLQQLMRKFTLPGGVQLTVASVFGQDYIDVYVPPEGAAQPALAETARVVEVVKTVYDAQEIGKFIAMTYGDSVRRSGAVYLTFIRPQPSIAQAPEVITIGNDANGSTAYRTSPTTLQFIPRTRPWVNSSVTGKRWLGTAGGVHHTVVTTMAHDGSAFAGYVSRAFYQASPFGPGVPGFWSLYDRAFWIEDSRNELNMSGFYNLTQGDDSAFTYIDAESDPGFRGAYGTYPNGVFRFNNGLTKVASSPASITSVTLPRPSIPQPDITSYLAFSA